MTIRQLDRRTAEKTPHLVWNAFVDLLAMENYEDLTERQRPAHLVFWYENEVQNGGHLQYFENRKGQYLNETMEALGLLGANCHQKVLREATELFLFRERQANWFR